MLQGLRTVLGIYRSHKAAGAICALLKPLVDRERDADGTLDESRWLAPFRLGFLATVIARLGRRMDPDLDGETTGRLQIEVWGGAVGTTADLIGERMLTLSLSEDGDFLKGCAAGLSFADALVERQTNVEDGAPEQHDLWQYYLAEQD